MADDRHLRVVHGDVSRTVANLESRIFCGEVLVAQANGNYAIFKPRQRDAATAAA